MKQWVDERIKKATVGFKGQVITSAVLATVVECLEIISNGFSDDPTVSLMPTNEKGKGDNGGTGKDQK